MNARSLQLVHAELPAELLTREEVASRLKIRPTAVTRLGLPRLPGRRGGLYIWAEVVTELERRRARRGER